MTNTQSPQGDVPEDVIERVARAIYAANPNYGMEWRPNTAGGSSQVRVDDAWDDAPDRHAVCRDEARAAIAAYGASRPAQGQVGVKALRAHLREHWLANIACDHEAKTDTASCSCSLWADTPHPSVGEAVDAWIDHVFSTLSSAILPTDKEPGNG